MAYAASYEIKENYLFAEIAGEQSFENHKQFAIEASEKCAIHGKNKIIIDIRKLWGQSPGTFKDYELAQFLSFLIAGKLEKIALIYLPENKTYINFFETTSRNNNLNLYAFQNLDEAEKWMDNPDYSFNDP